MEHQLLSPSKQVCACQACFQWVEHQPQRLLRRRCVFAGPVFMWIVLKCHMVGVLTSSWAGSKEAQRVLISGFTGLEALHQGLYVHSGMNITQPAMFTFLPPWH